MEYNTKVKYAEETELLKITHFENRVVRQKTDYEIVNMLITKFRNQNKTYLDDWDDKYAVYVSSDLIELEAKLRELGVQYSLSECVIETILCRMSQPFFAPLETSEYLNVKENKSISNSRKRTIDKIYNLACSNTWEYFLTLTFDDKKLYQKYGHDATDYETVVKALSSWLDKMRKANPNMKYLCVPEQHTRVQKNGLRRWHFHCLASNVNKSNFVVATDTQGSTIKHKGRTTYNILTYEWGFSTAIIVDDTKGISGYITKYITKNMCMITKGKKRYWHSRNLNVMEEETQLWDKDKYTNFLAILEDCERQAGIETYKKEIDIKIGEYEDIMNIHIMNDDILKLIDDDYEEDFSTLSVLLSDIAGKKKKAS